MITDYFCSELKRIIPILLVLVVLSQSFMQLGVVAYYQLNKTYITEKLCENKSNPKLHCNGHCYLTKQLKKAEEGEQKQASKILKEKEDFVYNKTEQLPVAYIPSIKELDLLSSVKVFHSTDFRVKLMKPPSC